MKPASNCYIVYLVALAITGLLIHFPCHAQDSNMQFWMNQKEAQKKMLSQWTPDFNYIFRSRVATDDSSEPVKDCHIINMTQRTGTVSDGFGNFKITANIGDSISFSAIGYETLTIVLTEKMYDYGLIIKLKPTIYEMEEVTIQPFIEMPHISKWERYTPPLPNQGGINIPTFINPVTALYNRFSKEGKQKKYYKSVIEETADFMIIGEKFNGHIVAQITGLKDDELVKFMSFCNFSNDFLRYYSPETIKRAIRTKYQEYRED
jgi:hypothetical protein